MKSCTLCRQYSCPPIKLCAYECCLFSCCYYWWKSTPPLCTNPISSHLHCCKTPEIILVLFFCFLFFFGFVLFLLQHKRVSPPYLIFPISITACCYFSLLKKKKWPYFLCSSHFTLLFVYNRAPQRSCLYCLCPMLSC